MEAAVLLYVNATKIYQFMSKNSEIKPYPSCLRNISKDFAAINMKKQDQMDMSAIFLLITISQTLVILSISINI